MTHDEMTAILRECRFEDYRFDVIRRAGDVIYLQAEYAAPCISSGRTEVQRTRKWLLSEHMTRGELVQTAFKCGMTSYEHRAREAFTWRGKRIFGPHFDVDALHQICAEGRFDTRSPPDGSPNEPSSPQMELEEFR